MPQRPAPRRRHAAPDVGALVFCGLVVLLVASLALLAQLRHGPASGPAPAVHWPTSLAPAAARDALAALSVVDPAREVAYDRTTDFGPAWTDVDHNGCDTRNDVLRRDLSAVRARPGTRGCVIVAGLLDDPYTGAPITFSKAQADAIQIDHLIPLHAAWMLGAWRWSPQRRLEYANDPPRSGGGRRPGQPGQGRSPRRWLAATEPQLVVRVCGELGGDPPRVRPRSDPDRTFRARAHGPKMCLMTH